MTRAYGITNAAPYAVAPPVGLAGDTYYNTAGKVLYLSDGTTWLVAASAPAINYWFGTLSGPLTALGTDISTTVTWTTTRTTGFTLAGSNQRITPPVAGKYKVTVELAYAAGATIAQYSRATATHYNSVGVQQASHSVVGGSAAAANYYCEAVVDTVFDMAAGDYIMVAGAIASPTGVFNGGFCSVTPVGGAKGDTGIQGPDVTLVQSNYWTGVGSTPSGTIGNDVDTTIGWTTQRSNGFTLASSGQRITPALASRYYASAEALFNTPAGQVAQYTRCKLFHYNSGGTALASALYVGTSVPAGGYGEVLGFALFDMAIGDYILIQTAIANATGVFIPTSSYCSVVPVGGTKGDKGDTVSGTQGVWV